MVRSKCVGRVGIKGLVVKDLMGVFEVVCQGKKNGLENGKGMDGKKSERKDRKVVLPKEGTVFRFAVPLPDKVVEEQEGEVVGDEEGVLEQKGDTMMENTMTTNPEDAKQDEELGKEKAKPKELIFELHGNQFIYRAADRANRKFKPHFLKDL